MTARPANKPEWWPLGASTLGTPNDPLPVVLNWLQDADAEYLELRVGPRQPIDTASSAHSRSALRRQLAAAGVRLLSLASLVRIGDIGDDATVVTDLREHLQLAADVGAGFVRIFPGAPIAEVPYDQVPPLIESQADVDARIVRRLAGVADLATDLGVIPVLETHDSHPRGADVARVLAALDRTCPGQPAGVIWDVLHPFRVGEEPAVTAALLVPYLTAGRGYIQLKDVASRTVGTPVNPGTGIIPLTEIFSQVSSFGYRGPVSLEWERQWYPGIAELPEPLAAAAKWLVGHRPAP